MTFQNLNKIRYALSLDMGGTFFKSTLIDSNGVMLKNSFQQIPVDSQGPGKAIIAAFIRILGSGLRTAEKMDITVAGIGIGIPGPFDYENGISLMKHKFQGIYGLNLKKEISLHLGVEKDFPVYFIHDVHAFLKGETWCGAARGYKRVIGLTLGTGLGAGFMINNEIIDNGRGGPLHSIYSRPYKNGIVEDNISARGIIDRYKELSEKKDKKNLDVKEIALHSIEGKDKIGLQVFEEFGTVLGKVMKPVLLDFETECLVLGGQISKSFELFSFPLKSQLEHLNGIKNITSAGLHNYAGLFGAAKLIFF